jgi:hypothetical protein
MNFAVSPVNLFAPSVRLQSPTPLMLKETTLQRRQTSAMYGSAVTISCDKSPVIPRWPSIKRSVIFQNTVRGVREKTPEEDYAPSVQENNVPAFLKIRRSPDSDSFKSQI